MKFTNYLNQLKTPENEELITIVESGYQAIFEYPHVVTHEDEYADLYLEKANNKGAKDALMYVTYLIRALINNEEIDIPDEFLVGDELTKIEHPQDDIEHPSVEMLIKLLEQFKDNLLSQIRG